jgi:hypothetical protein
MANTVIVNNWQKPKSCVYDSPLSMKRECWQEGEILITYEARLLAPFAKRPIPGEMMFFGANIGPWKEGQLVGDVEAIPADCRGTILPRGENE